LLGAQIHRPRSLYRSVGLVGGDEAGLGQHLAVFCGEDHADRVGGVDKSPGPTRVSFRGYGLEPPQAGGIA
jgi:hypothetical protein